MEIPEPKAFLMPQDYEKGIKLQFVPFSDSKDCLKAEKKTSATNKEFQQYSLAVKTEAGEYYELNFLMLSSFTKIYKDYGKKSENWLNNWVEAKGKLKGNFWNWDFTPIPIPSSQEENVS